MTCTMCILSQHNLRRRPKVALKIKKVEQMINVDCASPNWEQYIPIKLTVRETFQRLAPGIPAGTA